MRSRLYVLCAAVGRKSSRFESHAISNVKWVVISMCLRRAIDALGHSWVHLGSLRRRRLFLLNTSGANFRVILEAPPGFEPGMEVLQTRSGPKHAKAKP